MSLWVIGIGKLIGLKGAGDFHGQAVGHRIITFRRSGRNGGGHNHDLGTVCLEQIYFFGSNFVWADKDAAVTFDGGNLRQSGTGIARGGLDQRPSRLEQTSGLGFFDHFKGRPVFDRAARVKNLDLGQYGGSYPLGHFV